MESSQKLLSKEGDYDSVLQSDSSEELRIPVRHDEVYQALRRRTIRLAMIVGALTVMFIPSLIINLRLMRRLTPAPRLSCGNTTDEARSLGYCSLHGGREFEEAGTLWQIQNGTFDSFYGEGWPYFRDAHGTQRLSHEEMAMLADDAPDGARWYSTAREHSTHCAWNLLRMAHAYSNGLRLDHLTRSYPHAKHCVQTLLEKALKAPEIDNIVTIGM
ncbi:hypothetical protein KVR01_003983 [Diaporthe batatas]|uniref:uncharacterized protein n=1 Tax=Diaporthe batatas TaxID=748121 RepID=UPI001D058AED|nr:uncharacterized protein KVR01_003983 [Diaporthe batatas]KAG8168294.1 hypothetical protein KVR01_003983 [Diaporthe batatas]